MADFLNTALALISAAGALQQGTTAALVDVTIAAILVGLGLVGLALIIIARRDEALRNNQARLSAIIETAIDGIVTIDQEGVIRTCNPATERIFGYAPGELVIPG